MIGGANKGNLDKKGINFAKVGVVNDLENLTMAVVARGVKEKYEESMTFKRRAGAKETQAVEEVQ